MTTILYRRRVPVHHWRLCGEWTPATSERAGEALFFVTVGVKM